MKSVKEKSEKYSYYSWGYLYLLCTQVALWNFSKYQVVCFKFFIFQPVIFKSRRNGGFHCLSQDNDSVERSSSEIWYWRQYLFSELRRKWNGLAVLGVEKFYGAKELFQKARFPILRHCKTLLSVNQIQANF